MGEGRSGLVDLVRDFVAVEHQLRDLIGRHRSASVGWDEVSALFAGEEESPLFRLKERSHELFRIAGDEEPPSHRGVLFDLAVGSLFHEAMKFRESFYQQEVYGPRVRALRGGARADTEELFREFEKILAAGSERLEEGLDETEALLVQSRAQLTLLLAEHPEDGHVARYLVENAALVAAVFERALDELMAEIFGRAADGWACAGRSYLASGYFRDAEAALSVAIERGGDAAALSPLTDYARGMAAYIDGEYSESLDALGRWADAAADDLAAEDAWLARRAVNAVSCVDRLVKTADRKRLGARADALVGRLSRFSGSGASRSSPAA